MSTRSFQRGCINEKRNIMCTLNKIQMFIWGDNCRLQIFKLIVIQSESVFFVLLLSWHEQDICNDSATSIRNFTSWFLSGMKCRSGNNKKGNNASNELFHLSFCMCPHIPDSIENGSHCQLDDPLLWTNLKQCQVSNCGLNCSHAFTDWLLTHLICPSFVKSL